MNSIRSFAYLLIPLLITACTGTEEISSVSVAVMTNGGTSLRRVTPNASGSSSPITENETVALTAGVALATAPSGKRIIVASKAGPESRNITLSDPNAFPAINPDSNGENCLSQTASSANKDRLLVLSTCNDTQRLALYRSDGTLIWRALPSTFLPPAAGNDTPTLQLAVLGDVGYLSRPRLGGGSEIMQAAVTTVGSTEATVTTPIATVNIWDLTPYQNQIWAATSQGIQRLKATGEPDPTNTLSVFGNRRYDRLWVGTAGSRTVLAAWRSNLLNSTTSEPLYLWNGVQTSAVSLPYFDDLRDIAFAPDGSMYTLSKTVLTSYQTIYGFELNNWNSTSLLSNLNNPLAVTWLIPDAQ